MTDLFGDPDTGPFDFAHPIRTGWPNDALACPPGECADAAPDIATTPSTRPAADVLADLRRLVAALPGAVVVEDVPAEGRFRAVVRTPLLRFPDTVSVRVAALADGRTGVWIYSRSKVGSADLGTNRRRLAGLLAGLVADRSTEGAPP
nr:DUF1499 domain-containing protein [Oharaeibacter diazotrophicus]